jgi:hypothetical protein
MVQGAQLSNSFILLMALNEAKDPLKSQSPRTWDCGSQRREQVIKFLDTKIKTIEEDPDARWITTWNHYIGRIKYFFRWLYNAYSKKNSESFSAASHIMTEYNSNNLLCIVKGRSVPPFVALRIN